MVGSEGHRASATGWMTELDRPRVIGSEHTAPVRIQIRYELAPTDEGTRMRLTFEGSIPWSLQPLAPLAQHQATSLTDVIFANLERLARG